MSVLCSNAPQGAGLYGGHFDQVIPLKRESSVEPVKISHQISSELLAQMQAAWERFDWLLDDDWSISQHVVKWT